MRHFSKASRLRLIEATSVVEPGPPEAPEEVIITTRGIVRTTANQIAITDGAVQTGLVFAIAAGIFCLRPQRLPGPDDHAARPPTDPR